MTESKIIKSIVYVNLICLNVPYPPSTPSLKQRILTNFLDFQTLRRNGLKTSYPLFFLADSKYIDN